MEVGIEILFIVVSAPVVIQVVCPCCSGNHIVAVKHAEDIAVLLEHVAKVNWAKLLTLSKEPGLLMLVNSNSQSRFVLLVTTYNF